MRAFYVVGIYLQLGFCIYFGLVGEDYVVVFLVGLGLLGVRGDYDCSAEANLRVAASYAVDYLRAVASGSAVVHKDAEVHFFAAAT